MKGANGLGLPSVPSGSRRMLESDKEENAGLEKTESSNFIFLTLSKRDRNSPLTTGVLGTAAGAETKFSSCFSPLMKKKYKEIKIARIAREIIRLFILEDMN